MHERWYFSFHSTALVLCPMYFLFGVAKVLCWLPWQFIPSQTHLNYPKDNMLNTQWCCPFPHISAALGRFFNIHKILCLFYMEALFCYWKFRTFWIMGSWRLQVLVWHHCIGKNKKKKPESHNFTVMLTVTSMFWEASALFDQNTQQKLPQNPDFQNMFFFLTQINKFLVIKVPENVDRRLVIVES